VVCIYVGTIVLSLFMDLDNFDSGRISVGDEIAYAAVGCSLLAAIAYPFLRRRRLRPFSVIAVAVCPIAALITARILLGVFKHRVTPGMAEPPSARTLLHVALAIVAVAPLAALVLAKPGMRRDLFVLSAAVTAAGWLIVLAEVAIRYR
jgi:hypothetical protein